jgi:hypothetical protein
MHEFRRRVGVAGLRRINQHLLAPLVSWVTPANVSEDGLLIPSL